MIRIPQLPVSEAMHTLGMLLEPDRNNNKEFKYLYKVAKKWQTCMATTKSLTQQLNLGYTKLY